MDECCADKGSIVAQLRAGQASTLKAVLALNGMMFLVEFSAGLLAASTALLADSLDMLGDALVYGFSLYVVHRNARWKAHAALAKAAVMAVGALICALFLRSALIVGRGAREELRLSRA